MPSGIIGEWSVRFPIEIIIAAPDCGSDRPSFIEAAKLARLDEACRLGSKGTKYDYQRIMPKIPDRA
jgi:hypothetical protein